MPATPDQSLELFRWLLSAVGPVGFALLAAWWIANQRGQKKRAESVADGKDIADYAGVKLLAGMLERSDNHLKEHTEIVRESNFSIEKMSALIAKHMEDEASDLREVRESQRRTDANLARIADRLDDMRRTHA